MTFFKCRGMYGPHSLQLFLNLVKCGFATAIFMKNSATSLDSKLQLGCVCSPPNL